MREMRNLKDKVLSESEKLRLKEIECYRDFLLRGSYSKIPKLERYF